MPRPSLQSFLATARQALAASNLPGQLPITLVVGNEAADLDSVCCALLLAYFRTHHSSHANPTTLHVPLSNLFRADLALRPELTAVLRAAGLKPLDLLTLSDLPPSLATTTTCILVDHNDPTVTLRARHLPLIGCVDHHDDEDTVSRHADPRVIQKCGSCASLVVELYADAWMDAAKEIKKKEKGEQSIDVCLAHLALGPILVDTANLADRDKTTPVDVRSAETAETFLKGTMFFDRQAYFDELVRLKSNLEGLGFRDILRKDYKRWGADGHFGMGVSSVAQNLDYLFGRIGGQAAFLIELREWAREQNLDLAVLMTTSNSGGCFSRELLLWALNKGAVGVAKHFFATNKEPFVLTLWGEGALDDEHGDSEWRMAWKQGNTACSRKKVAPALHEAIRNASTG